MEEKLIQMKQLIDEISRANDAYYNTDKELMSNKEWDEKYDRLQALEEETGIILSTSPTQRIGYKVKEGLEKEAHEVPALSLDKTKDVKELADFLKGEEGVLSWKLDGLTIIATYENGKLTKAVTRGNGFEGEVITDNARNFANMPLVVPEEEKLIVRGEALITYEDFERINNELPPEKKKYENPRNLCSGSVRQLDPNETKRRNVRFRAFPNVTINKDLPTRSMRAEYLKTLGFDVVEYIVIPKAGTKEFPSMEEIVAIFKKQIEKNAFPSDGLVLQYNNVAYGESLGTTGKFPRDSIAFKWEDETKETTVLNIEWNASRTGLINPIAVFEPIRLEGTTVSRASLHNVSMVEKLSVTPGDTVTVYKANMIIPQIEDNLTRNGKPQIPCTCPACGQKAEIRNIAGNAKTLWCLNKECPAKQIGSFVHAVKRDALNIEGMSEETLQKLMDAGCLSTLPDLFHLEDWKEEIIAMDGFGEKSYENMINSANKARKTTLQRLLYALGITNVGRTASRLICDRFNYDVIKVINATEEELLKIPDIGEGIASSYVNWFKNQCNQELFENLLAELTLEKPKKTGNVSLAGVTFVVTGSLKTFENRNELKAKIEEMGGKVAGSVSSKTNYLINNDSSSQSGKNKKAKELGIPIITEAEFLAMIN